MVEQMLKATTAARDAVKKEVLRRAGIGYHEVVAGFATPSDLGRLVERQVEEAMSTSGVQAPLLQRREGHHGRRG